MQLLRNIVSLLEFMSSTHDGSEATDGDYKVITFNSSGTWTPVVGSNPTYGDNVEYLVIAGGGGGGAAQASGGGGAGGYLTNGAVDFTVTDQAFTITVGGGGSGAGLSGISGTNSTFSSIDATGGGGTQDSDSGKAGGSGGGGSGRNSNAGGAGDAGGNNGGGRFNWYDLA
jgi:hypothetical protein